MPWRFLDDRAIADVAFEATGSSLEELFRSSVDALVNTMVTDLSSIAAGERREVELRADSIDMLLVELLQSVIYYKDAEGLLMRVDALRIERGAGSGTPAASLSAWLAGERIDPSWHALGTDVKAVTLYRFRVEEAGGAWRAEVVLDV